MKATKLCYKGSLSPSKAPEFRNYHAGFTDLFRVQKYREMAGEVDAKSFEPGIQVQRPERNVCSLGSNVSRFSWRNYSNYIAPSESLALQRKSRLKERKHLRGDLKCLHLEDNVSQQNCVIKILTASQKRRSLGIAMFLHWPLQGSQIQGKGTCSWG